MISAKLIKLKQTYESILMKKILSYPTSEMCSCFKLNLFNFKLNFKFIEKDINYLHLMHDLMNFCSAFWTVLKDL